MKEFYSVVLDKCPYISRRELLHLTFLTRPINADAANVTFKQWNLTGSCGFQTF